MTALCVPVPRRCILRRSVLAMLAGLVTVIVLSLAVDHVMHVAAILPPAGQAMPEGQFLLALACRGLVAVLGCLAAAVLAPIRPMRHALILGAVCLALQNLGPVALPAAEAMWSPLAVIAATISGAWLGGWIEERARAAG